MTAQTLLMIGGSGAMGSHVIKQLLKSNGSIAKIRVLTRNPSGGECQQLVADGKGCVELVQGNVNDLDSVRRAVKGADVIFLNTNFWSHLQEAWAGKDPTMDPWPLYRLAEDADVEQSKLILEIARHSGVGHVILSSLDDASGISGGKYPAPHFDAKARVDQWVEQKKADNEWYANCVTSVLTSPYMENFVAGRMFRGGNENAAVRLLGEGDKKHLLIRVPLDAAPWPMVTLDDIGRFTTIVLNDEKTWKGKTLKVVSDPVSMEDAARIIERVTGIRTTYDPFTLDEYKALRLPERQALGNMFGLISEFGIKRDMAALRKINPEMDTFEGWLKRSGWKGEVGKVQKDNAQPLK